MSVGKVWILRISVKNIIFNFLDRFGFHHVMMAVGIWPVMIATIGETWRGQAAITRDVEDGLYSKTAYIITKVSSIGIRLERILHYIFLSNAEYTKYTYFQFLIYRCSTIYHPLGEYF